MLATDYQEPERGADVSNYAPVGLFTPCAKIRKLPLLFRIMRICQRQLSAWQFVTNPLRQQYIYIFIYLYNNPLSRIENI